MDVTSEQAMTLIRSLAGQQFSVEDLALAIERAIQAEGLGVRAAEVLQFAIKNGHLERTPVGFKVRG